MMNAYDLGEDEDEKWKTDWLVEWLAVKLESFIVTLCSVLFDSDVMPLTCSTVNCENGLQETHDNKTF